MPDSQYVLGLGAAGAKPRASLIISVYRDWEKLHCILQALAHQTCTEFEVVVSEDGQDAAMAQALHPYLLANVALSHLTQPDIGFRKNKALNRAIRAARSDLLIFIDGDCVPHTRFIESHVRALDKARISAGRRVELGPAFSKRLIAKPALIGPLSTPLGYVLQLPNMLIDHVKNPESGVYSPWLHQRVHDRPIGLVGCNFSCHRSALEAINGFNEDYEAPGIGEDSDLDWRFERAGFKVQNIKFLAPLFHLHHPRGYGLSQANVDIYERSRAQDQWFCARGLRASS